MSKNISIQASIFLFVSSVLNAQKEMTHDDGHQRKGANMIRSAGDIVHISSDHSLVS
jgi:hypothetical protein